MGTPGNVPGERIGTRAYRLRRPVHRGIPWRCATTPGFAVEAADIRCTFNNLAPLSMGQHAHELVAAVEVVGECGRAYGAGRLIGFDFNTA